MLFPRLHPEKVAPSGQSTSIVSFTTCCKLIGPKDLLTVTLFSQAVNEHGWIYHFAHYLAPLHLVIVSFSDC